MCIDSPKMFIDTNVVVRYLTNDPPDQAKIATSIVDDVGDLWITGVVLNETAYVLRNRYAVGREGIVDRLMSFVQKPNISVYGMDKDFVLRGLMMCRPSGRVSFGDAMVWAAARSAGAEVVYTFDRRFPSVGIEVRREF